SILPASGSALDAEAVRRSDGLQNRLFLDPLLLGRYPADVLDDTGSAAWFSVRADVLAVIATPLVFLGINYYSRHTVAAGASPDASPSAYPGSERVRIVSTGAATTQMGWEIHPDGMLDVLRMANELAPGLPLYITENGSAYDDRVEPDGEIQDGERTDYLVAHLEAARDAVREGLPLKGYFVWSLMDNFEWAWGYSRRFGVVYVDYETQRRIPKQSGLWLAEFLRAEVPIRRT
ncbi:MAG: beta-galactosidase, partial [Microbacteriaceae bacterium]|nr:beta-galactosidase [Microbacteriaceae bacterium]